MLQCSLKAMMNNAEIFSIWAPNESTWSRWVKPVLFAYVDSALPEFPIPDQAPDVSWCPPSDLRAALVLDLPGAEGVMAGLALATRGYRPVPLYNAVPLPFEFAPTDPLTGRSIVAVNVVPIICALRKGAETLAQLTLPVDAPPAFLLDANRAGDGTNMLPDEFDNRSVSFTTDFPSANFLAAHGIENVILIQRGGIAPQPDLAHSLRRWQDAGFTLKRKQIDSPDPPEPFQIPRPPWYGVMFQRVLASIGLRRASAGGFGAWIPDSSAGG